MSLRVATVALVLALAVMYVSADGEAYTTRFDNVDVDKVIKNKRLLDAYYKCLMSEGPCANDAAELKKILPDALQTKCAKCSETQKAATEKVVRHLIKERNELWVNLKAKYDPEGVYERDNKDELAKHGITV